MKVIVLGAGIAGITTAWYLAAGGAEVTVIERAPVPASEASHANGGHISTQSAVPWTGPAGLREFLISRFTAARTVRLLHTRDPGRLEWFARALIASRPDAHRRASAALASLARLSRDCLDALIAELDLDVCLERRGMLSLYRSERAFARARQSCGKTVRVLSRRETLAHEPVLAAAAVRPVGALLYPSDASGDCLRFCLDLAGYAQGSGVHFRYGETVQRIVREGSSCRGVATDRGEVAADACVVALGACSTGFLRACGIRIPILPLRGYTLTAPVTENAPAPGQINDVERHLVCSRLGDRFRAAAMADFTGLEAQPDWGREAQLERIVREWYPSLPRTDVEHWSCLRAITPDGPPILGASGLEGLWLNTGLGPLGWTLGCGAGRVVADLVLGRKPPIPLAGLTLNRFH